MDRNFQWPEWMRIETAAAYADVELKTVKLWIELGLSCTRIGNTPSRIRRSSLDRWMERHAETSATSRTSTTSDTAQ